MTTQEFSDQFDILYNNIGSDQAPGIDEYEKSVFLTKAEKQLVREYFERTLNRAQTGFDDSIKRQYDFSSLIKTSKLYDITHHWNNDNLSLGQDTFNLDGIPFVLPLDYYLTVNELITDNNNNKYCVLPLTYEEYQLRQSKPFPFPNKREAWRIITNQRGVNYGTTSIKYGDASYKDTADIICYTTFASEGKNMKFSLKERADVYTDLTNLHDQGIIKNEIWNILTGFDNIDGYAALKREANYHNLEHISMTVHHAEEPDKVKLWDNDYVANYTFDGVRNSSSELVNCVYQDTSAIAITSITVKGEASALGLLKTYMRLTKELENDEIGHDPYTLIARINFKHWEEGVEKQGTWLVWNGGWGYTKTFLFHKLSNPILIPASSENPTYPTVAFTNNDTTLKRRIGLVMSNSTTSNTVNMTAGKSVNAGKSEVITRLSDYSGKYIIGYYIEVNGAQKDAKYDIPFKIVYTEKPSTVPVERLTIEESSYTPDTEYLDGTKEAKRIDMVNVRHWDFADNFIWPQRIKFKDIEAFKVNSTIFEVNMKALTVPSVEIVGKFKNKIQSYMMRYVSKPKPIIIEDLATSDLSIDGYTEVMECELPEDCHEEILERAVTLAKLAYEGTSATLARANNNQ